MSTPEKLIRLFKQPYQRDTWLRILGEQLPLDRFSQPIAIQRDAQTFYQLGKTVLADGKELGVYEIKTNPQTQLHRNRVQMRQLAATQCRQNALDGALAVYYSDKSHWRFSFISMEYKLDEQGRLDRQESAPKRYTYLLGKDAKIRTAVERFGHLNKTTTLDDLKTAFAVGQLNKEFYKELFKWYERAKLQVVFPNDEQEEKDKHVSISLIRLLTRLLFVWFLREKGLVNRAFFEFDKVSQIIDWKKEGGYYKAILQNLFFATLNREIKDRTFRTTTNGKPNSNNYLVTNIYRYQNVFLQQGKNAILRLFERTPFLNGGLFECLDRDANEDEQQAYEKNRTIRKEKLAIRIDGFSDRNDNALHVPNDLFFNEDENHLGLITLLNQYQFTVEESTPLDADVALDPELLGLVFENLLASYNPETQQTARKASGSYYTPREIVNYMVAESLKAYFAQATGISDEKISRLFQTDDPEIDLTGNETTALIQAIDNIRIVDPAVGTGAFPMGILQRLVQMLGIVDPENKQWKQRQINIIEKLPDIESREQALKEIESIFSEKNRFNDFGRKLYLIKKCIYGVDIQPIACQIAKLRFFISLAIEQEPTDNAADNYGIKPLPNLETKFVAADTLLGLDQPAQPSLTKTDAISRPTRKKLSKTLPNQRALGQTDAVNRLQQDLLANRERHFRATTRQTKEKCRKKDKELRDKLATELKQAGFPTVAVDKIARWDPYNQNACADWFAPEYMFGVTDGFDVVISNPPYVVTKDNRLREMYKDGVYGRMNLYGLFIQRGLQLMIESGQLSFINPKTLLTDTYFTNLRKVLTQQSKLKSVVLIADRHNTFENVLQECIILQISRKTNPSQAYVIDIRAISKPNDLTDPQTAYQINSERVFQDDEYDRAFYIGSSAFDYRVFEQMNSVGVKLTSFGLKAETGKIQFDKHKNYTQTTNANNACRLIWAENIQRYVQRASDKRIGKEWLAQRLVQVVPPNETRGAVIATQRISANEQPRRIIATLIHPETSSANRLYFENHTNFINLRENSEGVFLLAALNSSLMEFIFRRLNSNTQVSAGEINSLPFPPMPNRRTLKEIETLVSDLLKSGGVDCRSDVVTQAIANEKRLDTLIGSLYGFLPDEVVQIQRQLPSYETVYEQK